MIKEWLKEYNPQNQQQTFDAIREIMQEVTLAGLQRSGFFEKAAFYGGTALRIFYQLDRYSEDLDFSLLSIDPNFSFEPYFEAITNEFKALGMTISINEKKKNVTSSVESAFLKSDTVWKELVLEEVIPQVGLGNMPVIKIKIEVDKKPPLGFETEDKLLLRPFSFYIKCFTLPSLFAGKMHALLFRKWYIKKGVPLDINHFLLRAQDTNDWKKSTISKEDILDLLKIKINTVNMNSVKEDIVRFIPDHTALDIWSQEYFSKLIQYLKFDRT
jgi:hypothetical protein